MLALEITLTLIGLVGGVTSIMWNVQQMYMARRRKASEAVVSQMQQQLLPNRAAVAIQRAYRHHRRTTRVSFGRMSFETTTSTGVRPLVMPNRPRRDNVCSWSCSSESSVPAVSESAIYVEVADSPASRKTCLVM